MQNLFYISFSLNIASKLYTQSRSVSIFSLYICRLRGSYINSVIFKLRLKHGPLKMTACMKQDTNSRNLCSGKTGQ